MLTLNIKPEDDFYAQKVAKGGDVSNLEFIAGNLNTKTLSTMRLLLFDERDGTADTFEQLCGQMRVYDEIPAISLENEWRVLTKIVRLCDKALQKYVQTYE